MPGLGQARAHERAPGDLLGQARDPAALHPLEGRLGLGERDAGDRDEDDDDDRELEGEELARQRRSSSQPDHYELNLLC